MSLHKSSNPYRLYKVQGLLKAAKKEAGSRYALAKRLDVHLKSLCRWMKSGKISPAYREILYDRLHKKYYDIS